MAKVYKSPNPNRMRCRGAQWGAVLCVAAAMALVVCAAVFRREIFLLLCLTAACAAGAWRLWNRAAVLKSGLAGESAAAKALAGLPHSYSVLCNVSLAVDGRRGELDAAVVGPGGVFVVEVKNHAGSVIGEADAKTWRQTRPVKGGRRIEKTLPNPLLQNKRQVELVRRLLEENGHRCPVSGCVYFANPHISVHVLGPGVFTDAGALCRAIQKAKPVLSAQDVRKIVDLMSHEARR